MENFTPITKIIKPILIITIEGKPGTGKIWNAICIKELLNASHGADNVKIFDTIEGEEIPEDFGGVAIVIKQI